MLVFSLFPLPSRGARKLSGNPRRFRCAALLGGVLLLTGLSFGFDDQAAAQQVVRVGFFPNITHAQALVGQSQGAFEKALGPRVRVEWKAFNAGPSAVEALFANAIDLTYIGPSPTISGYVQSHGEALRVIAGASSGGASLVVRAGANIHSAKDFRGKKIATPQLGNTQDVALRAWLHANGLNTVDKGGEVQVIPTENPNQLPLFLSGRLDAAWAPEPWATRLVQDAHATVFVDERKLWPNGQFVAAHLVVSTKFLREHPDVVKTWLRTHVEVTGWIATHPAEARTTVNAEIQKLTGKALPADELNEAFTHLTITYDPIRTSLLTSAQRSFDAGFLRHPPDLSNLYDLTLLNQVLAEKGKKKIQ
jgi:NitT/TauT family transport system substrate-binding protein